MARTSTREDSLRTIPARIATGVSALDRALAPAAAWGAACAAVLALQILLIFTHKPWLDEYQAIMIAVQAPDAAALMHWLSYEGHPPLWYFILRGLAQLVAPLTALRLAVLGCALALQSTLLFASPFSRGERLLIATSEFVLFEFLTVSRSLSLGAALLVVAVALWHRRTFWLALALLPMCDFLFAVLSLVLVALKWRERALWWPGVGLWIAVGLGAAWTMVPAPDVAPALHAASPANEMFYWLLSISTLALPFQGYVTPMWNEPPLWMLASWLWIVFLVFAWTQLKAEPAYRWLMMGFMALTLVFAVAVYRLSPRHLMLIALLLILMVWRLRDAGEKPNPLFKCWLIVISACGLTTSAIALATPFDTADQAARKIDALGLHDKHWLVYPISEATGISALSGIAFERDGVHCMQTLVKWTQRSRIRNQPQLVADLANEVALHGRSYLVTPVEIVNAPPGLARLVARIPAGYDGHRYNLYVLGAEAPERPVSLPWCVPGQRPFPKAG